jgi:nitrogenase molybdenum-iron protein alpha/beta subunit
VSPCAQRLLGYETEELIRIYQPDIFCAGIKEKFVIQKMGVPMKQLHSYDSGGPYAGFKGAINFYREIDRMVNSKVWAMVEAPWQKLAKPAAAPPAAKVQKNGHAPTAKGEVTDVIETHA